MRRRLRGSEVGMLKLSGRTGGVLKGITLAQTQEDGQTEMVDFEVRVLKSGAIELWITNTLVGGFGRQRAHCKRIMYSYDRAAYAEVLALLNGVIAK